MTPHLYIHIPFCDGKCHYCGFYSVLAAPSLTALYQDLPACELGHVLAAQPKPQKEAVRTVYMGGGTPAMLGSDGLKRLADTLTARLSFDAVEEWTVELNPASVTPVILKTLAAMGVNRLSIGVQSFDDATLERMGRRHSAQAALSAIRLAQDAGFGNVGIDLIAGLPGVTTELWQQTLDQAVTLGLTHLSVYALSLMPGTLLAAQVAQGLSLPNDDAQLAALAQAEAVLTQAGHTRYEISNYALHGFECQHNLGIWRGNDFLGLGPAAASRVGYARWTNSEDVEEYIEALTHGKRPPSEKETLDATDDAMERVVFALRLAEGFDPFADVQRFPILQNRADVWEERLENLARLGIAERGGRRWRLTARGREICDSVIRELF
ncbi:MAG: radical SAM family heme chaperone HemW [bacterium]